LPAGYVIPPASPAGKIAVQAALAELGRPYVFGAAGPVTFDCSGLMQWAWARASMELPHYTGDQWRAGVATTPTALLPGDLVLVPGSDGTLANPQHVGMFIGQGVVVEAPQTGDVVKVVTYESFVSGGLSGLRHIA
jgi:cell wall-associated NlpC family hydrolase